MARIINPWNRQAALTQTAAPGLQSVAAHALVRLENIQKVIMTVIALRLTGKLAAGTGVTVKGAGVQHDRGSRAQGTQAAHHIPRQVRIGGKSLETIIEGIVGERDHPLLLAVVGWQAATFLTDKAVNKADSLWELKGLARDYQRALQRAVRMTAATETAALTAFHGIWSQFMTESAQTLATATAHAASKTNDTRSPHLAAYGTVHGSGGGTIGKAEAKVLLQMISGEF